MQYRRIDTIDDLVALPNATVVLSAEGALACRFDTARGVSFGDDHAFDWAALALPATVIPIPTPEVP